MASGKELYCDSFSRRFLNFSWPVAGLYGGVMKDIIRKVLEILEKIRTVKA